MDLDVDSTHSGSALQMGVKEELFEGFLLLPTLDELMGNLQVIEDTSHDRINDFEDRLRITIK